MADTHCPYCALQCGMSLAPVPGAGGVAAAASSVSMPDAAAARRRLPLAVTPREFPTNRGGLCQKGWTSAAVLTTPDRLTTPLIRRGGELTPASWDEALDLIAGKLGELRDEHGPGSVAVFGGGGLTNEKAYALGKFARTVLRTPNIDYNGRFCMSSAAAAANRSLGADRGLPFPLPDLGGADVVVLLGSNVAETMPPAVQHLQGAREAGQRDEGGLVVVDPRSSATAKLTDDGAGVHLQPVPGTDMVVLLGLLHVVLAEGLADRAYLAERVTGFDDVARSVAAWWPERAEIVSGVPAGELRRVARKLAAASPARGGRGAYVLTGRGVEQSSQGTATVTAAINLALALGLVGREGSGYGAITGQGNGQGGREHGQKSDQLPGYRKIDDPAAREYVAGVWGVDPGSIPGPGKPAVQLLRSLGTADGPRALLVHGSNLLVSAPNSDSVAERLRALELLVVCDFVPSETARIADVVLPVTQWAEEEGTMTSLEGRVIRRRRAADAPGEARSELWILAELARRLGTAGELEPGSVTFSTDPSEVFDELALASKGGIADYSGLTHARLDKDEAENGPGYFWPVPATPAGEHVIPSDETATTNPDDMVAWQSHPGTPRMFVGGFPTPDGRARMVVVDHAGPADDLRPGAPVYLVTGRVLQHYQSGAQTHRVAELERLVPEPYVELHPVLGVRVGVPDGARARLTTSRGVVEARARWTDAVRPDTVFMPFHWSGTGSVNRVTTDATDPVSGMPEFKVCAVDVAPVPEPALVTTGTPSESAPTLEETPA
ncbi:molybdopterin oxidoreductase family protein [Myceligenerans crystallogenes]|uniref:Molybdopterin oxidoreductase family protein n=1 Tax=Myceligenerans crystallogenes TaxID=316335 RepID=A0ABN2N1Q5_9MICO